MTEKISVGQGMHFHLLQMNALRRDFFIIEKRGNYNSFPNDQNLPKTGKELAY